MNKLILSIPLLIAAQVASADPAAINSVRVSKEGGLYKFDVTISHGDTGWDHFSELPAGTTEVRVQVRETQSGWGKKIRKVQIK